MNPVIIENRPVFPGDWIVGFGESVGLCIGVAVDNSLYSFHLFEKGRFVARRDVVHGVAADARWRRASREEIRSVSGAGYWEIMGTTV
jgi:hypothetical protein